jgi:tetratricopeptide (TPR) repeat protein
LQKALLLDRNSARVQLNLGRLAVLREKWPTALEHLTACVADRHARKLASTMRAQAYRHLGDRQRAEADETQAGSLPEDERWPDPFVDEVLKLQRGLSARMTAADALRRGGRIEAAADILTDTARKYTASPLPWLTLADLWREMGEMDRAEQACRQAIKADPNAAQAWFGLGSFQAPSRPQEAAESFRHAIRLRPDHAVAHYNLGCCLRRLGESADAAEEFRRSLRCRPDFTPARTALQEIGAKFAERKDKATEGSSK